MLRPVPPQATKANEIDDGDGQTGDPARPATLLIPPASNCLCHCRCHLFFSGAAGAVHRQSGADRRPGVSSCVCVTNQAGAWLYRQVARPLFLRSLIMHPCVPRQGHMYTPPTCMSATRRARAGRGRLRCVWRSLPVNELSADATPSADGTVLVRCKNQECNSGPCYVFSRRLSSLWPVGGSVHASDWFTRRDDAPFVIIINRFISGPRSLFARAEWIETSRMVCLSGYLSQNCSARPNINTVSTSSTLAASRSVFL